MRVTQSNGPAIGAIEVYYPEGMRSIAIPAGTEMLAAAMEAHDIWEESDQQLRVEVIRFHADGGRECVLPLEPNGKSWTL
jgi:hypothetical protein